MILHLKEEPMRSSSLGSACAFVALGAVALFVPRVTHGQSVPQWTADELQAWYVARNAGDATGLSRHYAEDAVLLPPDGAPVRGREGIHASFAADFRETSFECSGANDEVRVMGNMAVAWGHDSCTETPKAGGSGRTTLSRWMSVYERLGGEWLIVYETWENTPQ
jgi:uncharacterized protein (TIGR02246 family)